ncbi:MAG: hypothetical protein VB122_08825, partial [Erysipelotrichales bacterium]|nr:hypothetical protein [Erysipelotrichales bacterium]
MKSANTVSASPQPSRKSADHAKHQISRKLDMQQLFSWLIADGIVKKDEAKAYFNYAQGIYKNATAMHPLTAIAQTKLSSAQPPNRLLTLDWLN